MVQKYNQSLGIKEQAKKQFQEKKERDKSIGKVDVIDLETGNRELKKAILDSNRMNLNLFDDDISIKLASDRGELDEIYNTLKDLINSELIKPTPNNKNIRYYKDQINIIEDYFFKQDRRNRIDFNPKEIFDMTKEDKKVDIRNKITFNPKETFDMSKEDRLSSTLRNTTKEADKMSDLLKEIRTPPKQRRKRNRNKPKSPLVERIPDNKDLEIEKIEVTDFMIKKPNFFSKLDNYEKLTKYLIISDEIRDKIEQVKNKDARTSLEKRYNSRYNAISKRKQQLDDLEDRTTKLGAVESKKEISGNGMKKRKTASNKKQGKTPSNKKSNNKSLGKQEQIYYLLSQRAGNNNKLMKKRLQKNKK
jgi:hypothetical protein